MVIGIIGENCSGKSTLAEKIKAELGAEIVTGKDYLRMAKSESEAVSLFREKLRKAVSGDNIIYVIADPEHVKLLPDGAIRILVTTDLETIKERFRARMRGNLPAPVALMLERKHGMFDSGEYDYRFDGATGDAKSFCEVLKNVMRDSVTPFAIRRLSEDERQTALDLAWAVFSEFESPDYSAEGTEEFRKCLHDEGYLSGLHYYGTFDGEKLIGEIAIRPDRKHICFFFVDGRYHRRGIGTRMFRRLLEDYPNETITLNSSPYGLPFYQAIGFAPTDEEKTVNGIRFTPMKYEGRQVPGKPTERNERIEESVMKELVLYIHGKGGNAEESEHYKPLFPECEVVGLNYQTFTPWETGKEIREAVIKMNAEYDSITLIANSIGAFFSMNAGIDAMIRSAFFISPIVDMEKLILNMMSWANVTEKELKEKGVIPTSFGEDLSWEYLCYVREHPVCWTVPTRILYGSWDNLTSYETISAFAKTHGTELTVMEEGEHWFHTDEQMRFLDDWIMKGRSSTLPS